MGDMEPFWQIGREGEVNAGRSMTTALLVSTRPRRFPSIRVEVWLIIPRPTIDKAAIVVAVGRDKTLVAAGALECDDKLTYVLRIVLRIRWRQSRFLWSFFLQYFCNQRVDLLSESGGDAGVTNSIGYSGCQIIRIVSH
ncbi:hypothetical protein [Minwuia thermotolerans]|uniref:hypothetical protein n=1 Tax=Minwuia thermotolerans TaxID=2056226 RepID=UPI001F150341|nr:hypothetical protein [Minwuia thermotolerans]